MARRDRPGTALVAAASRPLRDPTAGIPRQAATWQAEAWTMFDEIGEIKFGTTLAGNQMAKLRLYVAVYPEDDPGQEPVPVLTEGDTNGLDPELAAQAEATLDRLASTDGGTAELLRSLNINLEVAGELWLVGWGERGPGTAGGPSPEYWEVRSVSEVAWSGKGPDRIAKVTTPGETPRELDPRLDSIIRMWIRHARYGELADSNLRGVLADCRALIALEQQSMAETRSRVSAGGFTVPNELTIAAPRPRAGADPPPPDDPEADPFLLRLEQAMIGPLEDLTDPSSVAPFVIRGPAEFLQPQYLRKIELGRQSSDTESKIEARVQRIARGMNLPPEVIMGHQQTTFANAAQVDQDTFEDFYEPRARLLADTLTSAYLRPELLDAGHPPDQVQRLFVWYDPALLLASPDTDANAGEAFDNQAISWQTYRRAKGYDESDAPSGQEMLVRAGLMRGILTADLTAQLLNLIEDPRGEPVPRLVPPPPPGGGQPAEGDVAEEAALMLALIDRGLLEVAPDGTLRGRHPLARTAIEAAATEVLEDLPGRVLLDIDRETRARLQAAFDAALLRALERAGARIRSKANGQRPMLARVPSAECVATLGPKLVAAAGVGDDELLAGAWDQLEGEFYRLGESAQKRALGFAGRIVGGFRPEHREVYGLRQAADLDQAWAWTKENLTALAKARLYEPNPKAPDVGEFDPTSQSPTGLVRQAMRIAGGVSPSDNASQISTSGEGSAWVTTPDGTAPGGIATGALIEGMIRDEGGAVQGYRWVYGPALRSTPFLPHLRLDGLVFQSFTDDRLLNTHTFPGSSHYIPGDHRGCVCDYEPIFLTPAQVEQLRREGRYDGPEGVPTPTPPERKVTETKEEVDARVERWLAERREKVGARPVLKKATELPKLSTDARVRKLQQDWNRRQHKVEDLRWEIEDRRLRIEQLRTHQREFLGLDPPTDPEVRAVWQREMETTDGFIGLQERVIETNSKALRAAERAEAKAKAIFDEALASGVAPPPTQPKSTRGKKGTAAVKGQQLPDGPEPVHVTAVRDRIEAQGANIRIFEELRILREGELDEARRLLAEFDTAPNRMKVDQLESAVRNIHEGLRSQIALQAENEAALQAAINRWIADAATAPDLAVLRAQPVPEGLSSKQMTAWLQERWGGLTPSGRERMFGFVPGNAKLSEHVALAWQEMANAYPRTWQRIEHVGDEAMVTREARKRVASYAKSYVKPMGRTANADAWDYPDARWIRMGQPTYDENVGRFRRSKELGQAQGWNPPGTGSHVGVFRHEFGHHLHYEAKARSGGEGGKADQEIIAAVKRQVMRDNPDLKEPKGAKIVTDSEGHQRMDSGSKSYDRAYEWAIKQNVSGYAATNISELSAEAVGYVHSAEPESRLAREIHAILVRYAEG